MKKILLVFIAFMFVFAIGCGTGFFQEETVTIESIESSVNEKGDIVVTITYLDDVLEPVSFTIPKGLEGNGIKSIITSKDPKTNVTSFAITYTESEEVVTFEIADGIGIKEVICEVNEETLEKFLVIEYTDGSKSTPFLLPEGDKGDKGDPGNGILSITSEEQLDGSVKLTITFTDKNVTPIEFVIPAAKEGIGVKKIEPKESNGKYILAITYSDDSYEDIEFNKPKDPNAWYRGSSMPNNEANEGDYYFDTANKKIYAKDKERWNLIVDFNQSLEFCEVQFDLNSLEYVNEWYYKGNKIEIDYNDQEVTIGANGNWFIGNFDTNISATIGVPGQTAYQVYCEQTQEPLSEELYNLKLSIDETFDLPYVLKSIKETATFTQGQAHYYVQRNTYFNSSSYVVPIPTREGYRFLGWYTNPLDDVNSAKFTDLTIVLSNLKLSARWEKIN